MNISTTLSEIQTTILNGISDPVTVARWIAIAIAIYALYLVIRMTLALIVLVGGKLFMRRIKPVIEIKHLGPGGILIIGDSTGVGTGASDPGDTIAGRLAKEYPRTNIINLSVNGATTKHVVKQLKSVEGHIFDIIIIITGGNDIWTLAPVGKISASLFELLTMAKRMSEQRVLLLFYGNIGLSPIFPPLFRNLFLKHAYTLRDIFRNISAGLSVPLIELFTVKEENPFQEKPREYFSSDMMHPSSKGYDMWYARMWRIMSTKGYHFHEAENPSHIL